jgi:hypothetical protein
MLPVYYFLAVVFTWPLAVAGPNTIVGDGKDGWMEAWNLWWVGTALGGGYAPYHFATQFAPGGVTNYLHALAPLEGVLALPVTWTLGAVPAYNFACWSALALAGFAGYVLGRDVAGSRPAGFVAGLAIGFAPHQFAQLLGHMSVASIQFFVLGAWCLFRSLRSGERRSSIAWALWSGACLGASGLSHLYTMVFQLLTTALLGGLWAVFGETAVTRRYAAARSLLAMGTGLAGLAPFLVAVAVQSRGPDAPGQQEGSAGEIRAYSADLLAYALPSPFHPAWGEQARDALRPLQGTLIEKVVFPGYVVLALGVLGAAHPSTRRRARIWWPLALAGLLLSLGPTLQVAGSDTGLPLPAGLLYALPLSSLLRAPARFSIVFSLGLGVCAALGLSALLHTVRPPGHRRFAASAVFLLLLELLPAPFLTSRRTLDPWYTRPVPSTEYRVPSTEDAHSVLGTRYSVLEVPFDQYDTRPLAAQMVSGLPIAGGYLSRMPVYPLSRGVPPFTDLGLNRVPGAPLFERSQPSICSPAPGEGDYVDIMRLAGVRYLALHPLRLDPGDPRPQLAARLFPAGPAYESDEMLVYDTGGGEPSAALFGGVEDAVDWGPLEENSYRWTSSNEARIHVWSASERTVSLELALRTLGPSRAVTISARGQLIGRAMLEQAPTTLAAGLYVPRGFTTVLISTLGPPLSPSALGLGNDPRPLTMSLSECLITAR